MVDRRKLMAGHLLLTAAGAVLAATASRTWELFTGLAVAGLFAVVVQTTVAYAAALSTPEERGRTLGVVTSGVVVGILGARVAAGALAAVWGWRSVYVALAVLLVTLAGLVLRALPPDPRTGHTAYRQVLTSLGGLFRQRLFVSRGLIAFFLFASFGTLWSGLALPLAAAPWHLSTARIGLFGLAGWSAHSAPPGRDAGPMPGSRAPSPAGRLCSSSSRGWPSTQASWSLWLVAIGAVVLDFAVQAVHVSNQHLLTMTHPDRTSSVVGGYMIFYSLGSALGATTTTTVFAGAGWTGSSILGAAFAACALVVWTSSRRRGDRSLPAAGRTAESEPVMSLRPGCSHRAPTASVVAGPAGFFL